MPNITSQNAKLTIAVRNSAGVVVGPFTVQGYHDTAMFATEEIQAAEVRMGCDGKLAGGYTPAPVPLTISLMANSPSVALFEAWYNAQKALGDVLTADGTVLAPSLEKAYTYVKGFLTRVTPMPEGQKTFGSPVVYQITWESFVGAAIPAQ